MTYRLKSKATALFLMFAVSTSVSARVILRKSSPFYQSKIRIQSMANPMWIVLWDNSCGRPPIAKHNIYLESKYSAYAIKNPLNSKDQNTLDWLEKSPCVLGVTNQTHLTTASVFNDPLYPQQTFWSAEGLEGAQDLERGSRVSIQGFVPVAVIDSGVQTNHPDLMHQFWSDGQGHIGYDFVNNDADPQDDYGHGTHVSGLIAAEANNGVGGIGVTSHVRLMVLKTQDQNGNGTASDVINAIGWAVAKGAAVINLSLAGQGDNPAIHQAIQSAVDSGVVVVTAAGNDGAEITAQNFVIPAAYAAQIPGLLSVGSIDALSLAKSDFSNFSPSYVEIAASGSSGDSGILSTVPGSSYEAHSGTSMSAPQVSGAAAVAIGFFKTNGIAYTPSMIEQVLESSAVSDPALSGVFAQGRRLNLERLSERLKASYYFDSTGGFDETH